MSHNNITTSYDSIADQLIDSDYQYFISRYISEKGLRTIYEKIIQTHKEYLDNIISRMMSFFLHETSREYDWNCGSFFQHIPSEILFSKIPVEISLRTRLYESIGINWCLGEFMLSDERVITFLEDTVANAKNSESWWRAAFSMEKMGLINAINYLKSDLKSKHVPSLQECLPLDNKRLVIGLLLHSNINNLQKIILPTIKNILRKKNPHEPSHLNAAWLAGRYRFRDNQVEQILHKNLYHESYEVVFYTLRAIVEIGSIEFKDDLIKLLDREEHHLQIMAADGLAKLNCLDLIKPLRKRLLDESRPDVISSITRAFYLLTNFSERKKTFIRNNISANENGMIADEGDKWYVNPYIYHEFSSSQDPENLCFSLIKESLTLKNFNVENPIDIGSGTGRFAWYIINNIDFKGKLYCLDSSKNMVNFIKQRIKRENLLPNKILVKHTRINELEKTIASELSTLIVANFAFPSKYSDIENNYLELRSIYKSLKQNGLLITVGWDESFNDELSEMWYRYIPDKIVSRNFEDWRLKRSNLFQSPRNCGLNWYKRGIRVPLKFSSVDIAARVMGYLFGRSAIDDILINNKTVWEMSIGITIDNKESIKKIFSRK